MPSIDLTRSANQPAKRYIQTRWHQGRVITDDDLNDAEAITGHERTESLVDVIGPSGTSDDALRVSGVVDVGGHADFELGEGTIYVGGRRLRVPAGVRYRAQDDFFDPHEVPVPAGDRHDLVWCEVQEVPVTAEEDAELREVGLGGPDTAGRIRLVSQVHVEVDVDDDCEAAWLATAGADVDDRGALVSDARLAVSFVPGTEPDDLCTPEVAGGYLTHLNQAIRVQCIDDATFTWGFDNASSVYRAELGADGQTVKLLTTPPDDAHRPRSGQVVELLPWSSVLSNGELQAGQVGHLAVVDESYDPDTDVLTLTAAAGDFGQNAWLEHPDAAEFSADGVYVYLRVWERGADTSGPAIAFTSGGAAVPLGTTGLEVSFTGTGFLPGDHWIIAARPAEPDQVVPWDFVDGRPPHGPVRLRAPLGVIHWESGVPSVTDCRRRFRSLTELRGCCEFTVGDGGHTFGDYLSIQEAVDALPPQGGRICVRAGHYDQRVEIHDRTFVEISGCGHDTVIAPEDGDGPTVSIEGSSQVVLRSMRIVGLDDEAVQVGAAAPCDDVHLEDLSLEAGPAAAVVEVRAPIAAQQPTRDVVIDRCEVAGRSLDGPPSEGEVIELWPAVVVQADDVEIVDSIVTASEAKLTGALGGIQIAGLSRRVALRRNTVSGGNGNGLTIGSLIWVERGEVGTAVNDYIGYAEMAASNGWYVWFDGGCIQIGGDPVPGDDPDEPVLIPFSEGPVEDLVVEDNTIMGMAADGIGVVRFFDPLDDETADIVTLVGARIDRNRIVGNRRTPRAGVTPAMGRVSAQGGIALAEVLDLRLRDNRIVANGASEQDPMCGVFMLHGEGLQITGNDIADNGAIPNRERQARIGLRGGIVVRNCRGMSVGEMASLQAPEVAALTVTGNRVSHPAGQALWAMGSGQMLVHDNQLSAGCLAVNDLLSAVFAMVEADIENLGDALGLVLLHLVGLSVTIINTGLPIDLINARATTMNDRAPGIGSMAMLGSFLTTAEGAESYDLAVERETHVDNPAAGVDDIAPRSGVIDRLLQGGHVSFTDNQVTLDLVDEGVGLGLCSVLLATFDDLSVQQNQVRCLTQRDLILVDVVAFALWTVRCQGNRFQEIRAGRNDVGGLGTLFSGLIAGWMNTTTGNQTSGELLTASFDPALLVDEHNLSWA